MPRNIIDAVSILMSVAFTALIPGAAKAQTTSPTETDKCEKYRSQSVPRFKVVRKTRIGSGSALLLFVTIAPVGVDRNRLIALSCQLGIDHSVENELFVWILDNERAAKHYNPQGEGNDRATASAVVGLYGFSRRQGGPAYGQSLEWRPNRANRQVIHIDLGPPPEKAD